MMEVLIKRSSKTLSPHAQSGKSSSRNDFPIARSAIGASDAYGADIWSRKDIRQWLERVDLLAQLAQDDDDEWLVPDRTTLERTLHILRETFRTFYAKSLLVTPSDVGTTPEGGVHLVWRTSSDSQITLNVSPSSQRLNVLVETLHGSKPKRVVLSDEQAIDRLPEAYRLARSF